MMEREMVPETSTSFDHLALLMARECAAQQFWLVHCAFIKLHTGCELQTAADLRFNRVILPVL
jgi:hypothetical protein